MKFTKWLNDWLEYYVRPFAKQRTFIKYQMQVEKYILPEIGDVDTNELSADVIQKFSARLTQSGLASNTINNILSTLNLSLKRAAMLGLLKNRFSDAIVRPKPREKQVESFTKREQYILERYAMWNKRDNLFGIVLSLYTGLRVGELLALKWSDIDFAKKRITVNKCCRDEWENGKYIKIIETAKTQASERVIPFPKQLLPKLRELKKRSKCQYVIPGKSEYGAQMRSYQRTFECLLKTLNLPHRGIHALRHTFATRALEVGMDVKTLSEIMGHSDPTVTLKRYAHSMFEHKSEMMNKLGKLFT